MEQSATKWNSGEFLTWMNASLASEMEVTFSSTPNLSLPSESQDFSEEILDYSCPKTVDERGNRKRDLLISGEELREDEKRQKVDKNSNIEYWSTREDSEDDDVYQPSVLDDQYVASDPINFIEAETLNTTDWNLEQGAKVDYWNLKIDWIVNEQCELRYKAYLTRSAHDSLVLARTQVRRILEELNEAQERKASPGTFLDIEKRLAYAVQRVEIFILRFCRNRRYRFVKF